ncbi:hypothetical protein [Enterobacter hormaechei]|uniref:hypothetical protein n=1 Tax=Enterobacter hormaechei TaxID=158836 RepID=UPI00115EF173|nr:hypothetical protein [Enterobacter hormaechei]
MAKTAMGYMVRAWKLEFKDPAWNMRSRKRRAAMARDCAGASIEIDNDVQDAVEAEIRVQEEVSDWGQ